MSDRATKEQLESIQEQLKKLALLYDGVMYDSSIQLQQALLGASDWLDIAIRYVDVSPVRPSAEVITVKSRLIGVNGKSIDEAIPHGTMMAILPTKYALYNETGSFGEGELDSLAVIGARDGRVLVKTLSGAEYYILREHLEFAK
jgi:hypothetical protein